MDDEVERLRAKSCDRMRSARLRDGFNEDTRSINHAEHGPPGVRTRARVIAPVALVEPHLIRAGDITDIGIVLGFRVDDEGCRISRVVVWSAAQKEVLIRARPLHRWARTRAA